MNKKKGKPPQINIYPSAQTSETLDAAIERYGDRHKNARTRSGIVSELVELYLPMWVELMAERDTLLTNHLQRAAPKSRRNE